MIPLVILLLALVLVVFPLWAIVRILAVAGKIATLERGLRQAERELRELREKIGPAAARSDGAAKFAPIVPSRSALPAPPRREPEPVVPPAAPLAIPPVIPPGAEPPILEPVFVGSTPAGSIGAGINWEQFMGAKLFAWLGGFAAFLGAAFFVKYSFEHDFIPPEIRVALGFLLAIGLVAGGLIIPRERYAVTAQTLCATGIVTLYAVTFACNSVYHFAFFGPFATFLLMTLITAMAFLLAVRLDAQVVAILGMLGGFLTPVLLSTGHDNPGGLFGYLALLDVGLIAVALHRRWHFLVPLGAAGTALMQISWAARFFADEKAGIAIVVCLGFSALFLATYLVARRLGRASPEIMWSAVALPFLALAFGFGFLGYPGIAARPGLLFTFALAADGCLLALAWCDDNLPKLHLVAGLVVFALLAAWTTTRLTTELLPWALAFYLLHAVLHTAFPLVVERHRPAAAPTWWSQLFPPLALLPFLLLIMATQRLPLANPSPVFGLALLLVVLTLGLAFVLTGSFDQPGTFDPGKRPAMSDGHQAGVEWLPGCTLAGVAGLEYAWHARHFAAGFATVPLAWFLVFHATFAAHPFLFRRRFAALTGPWAVAAIAGVLQFPLVYRLVQAAWPNDFIGVLPALFAVPPLLSLVVVLRTPPADERVRLNQLAWFGGVALLFITLIFPIQFERQWLTLGWALEGAALLWLFHRVPHAGLRATGAVLLVAAFVRLAVNPAVLEYHARSAAAPLNWYLYSYGLVTASLFLGARLTAPPRDRILRVNAPPLFNALGTVLAFLLLNIEIADYFSAPGTRVLTFQFSGNFARDMTYTIAWALFALGLLLVSIWQGARAGRYAAIGLLSVALLKVFFHDLARLDSLHRIGALFAMAVIAVVASVAYQRFLPGSEKNAPEEP